MKMNSLFLAKILRRIPNGVRTLLVLACLSVTPTLHAQLFSDNFNAGLNARWQTNSGTPGVWSIVANELNGGPNSGVNYGYIYIATNTWTNYSISAKIRFSAATVWGGGIGGRLDATTGAHYAAWIYPESSPAGVSSICRLFRFSSFTAFTQIGSA